MVHTLPVIEVMDEELPVYYITIGSVISDNRIQITSRITGYINEISVREGQQIHKGDLLVSLDSSDIDGAIQQAKAAVNKFGSALKDAQIDLERYETLFKEKSVPENALRKIRLQRDVSRETLHAALAALETAKSQHQYILIKSPKEKLHRFYHVLITPILDRPGLRGLVFLVTGLLIMAAMMQVAWQFVRPQGMSGPLTPGCVAMGMLPKDDKNTFNISIDMPEYTPVETTDKVAREVGELLRKNAY
ncbi:MAG: biotin/lipoyl-binding protein [Desulfobulbaceae bacterium]|nr:biotin/lipoyl-binding protein [Desulfobulbaceae bacterium]